MDLLFYHRELQCLVAIDLKIDDFKPEYLGKMEFYLEALDRDEKKPHENPIDDDGKNSFWIQSGAELDDGMWLEFGKMDTNTLGISGLNVSTQSGAQSALSRLKDGLGTLSSIRSTIGAQQNRLEHTIKNEENILENTTAAESRIRDTDMAKEMVENAKDNILLQAGQTMLAQANQSRQGILSLLQ